MLILTNAHAEDAKWDCGRDDESGKFRLALHTPQHCIELLCVTGLSYESLEDLIVAARAALQEAGRETFRERLERRLERLAPRVPAQDCDGGLSEFATADGTPTF